MMVPAIRLLREQDIETVVRFSLAAWLPVFESFERILGPQIFARLYPDWRTSQAQLIDGVCRDSGKYTVHVAELGGTVVGFVAYTMDHEQKLGEIYLLAVGPDYQNRGIGTELNRFALGRMEKAGMTLAYVDTGGDPSHAPARRSYEKAGFTTAIPVVHYYKDLS